MSSDNDESSEPIVGESLEAQYLTCLDKAERHVLGLRDTFVKHSIESAISDVAYSRYEASKISYERSYFICCGR
jgi:hypothetical protein